MYLKYSLWKNTMTTGNDMTVESRTAREEVSDEQKPGFHQRARDRQNMLQ
jgi:hypothetical protein